MKHISTLLISISLAACHPTYPTANSTTITALPTPQPDIHHFHAHALSDMEALSAAEALARRLEKYGMSWSRQDLTISFKVNKGILSGTHGALTLSPHRVEVSVFNFPSFIPNFLAMRRIKKELQAQFTPAGER